MLSVEVASSRSVTMQLPLAPLHSVWVTASATPSKIATAGITLRRHGDAVIVRRNALPTPTARTFCSSPSGRLGGELQDAAATRSKSTRAQSCI